jgi:hypothetical protein
LVHERDPSPEAAAELSAVHRRYQGAPPPTKGEGTILAYRLCLFSLDRSKLWERLTRYRTTADGEPLDGTNNATERALGWWLKERYVPMRGYKRQDSVLNVSRLVASAGSGQKGNGVDLAVVVQ